MLEGDLLDTVQDTQRARIMNFSGDEELDVTSSGDYMRQRRAHFVSLEVFMDQYWPHFPQHLTKRIGKYNLRFYGSQQSINTLYRSRSCVRGDNR